MEQLNYGFWILGGVTIAYCLVTVDLACRGNWPMSLVFGGYSLANVGMMVAIK